MPTWYPSAIIRQNDAEDFGRQAQGLVDELGTRIGDANQQLSADVKSFLPSLESLTPWAQGGESASAPASAASPGNTDLLGLRGAGDNPGLDSSPFSTPPTRDDYARPSAALPSLETLTPWAQQTPPSQDMSTEGITSSVSQPSERPNVTPAEPVHPDASSPDAFLKSVTPAARAAAVAFGLPSWAGDIAAGIASNETGFGKAVAGNNFFGIKGSNPDTGANTGPVNTWEVINGVRQNIQDTFRAYADPQESFQDFFRFLQDNPRYQQALQARDPVTFIKAIHGAGYATDPKWSDQVLSIADQAKNVSGGTNGSAYTGGNTGRGVAGLAAGNARRYPGGEVAGGPRPSLIDQAALGDPDKWSLCGPVAAVLAATKRGADWSVAQAKQLASSLGLWDPSQGMHGLGSEVQLLNKLGVSAATGAADQQRLAEDAQNGNTPIVSTDGHYFVLHGYDPSTGKFDTGNTGTVYRGGSRWLNLDDMQRLAGAVQGAAYIDNPSSPTPSVVASKGSDLASTQALERSGADTSDQGNPDQPSGLSRRPLQSDTPTFPAPPEVPESLQPQSRAIDQGMQADSPEPTYQPSNLGPAPAPLYADQPESDVYTPRASDAALQDTSERTSLGETLRPGGALASAVDVYSSARQSRQDWDRGQELNRFATEHGYFGALDPRFEQQYPAQAEEARQLISRLVVNAAAPGPEPMGMFGNLAPKTARSVPTWASSVDNPAARYDMHYEIRPLYELQASHTDAFTPNPDFPSEIQPRIRDRLASREQVGRIAQNLTPDALLAETHRLDSGAPIIGPDNAVESGNGRMLALRQAQQQHPERWADYQQQLRTRADELGLDPQQLAQTPNPVLVRVRTSEVDRPAFAAEANRSTVLEMSPYERAQQDSSRIHPDLMAGIQVSETQGIDQALMAPGNRDALRSIMATIPQNERAALVTGTGELNAQGLQRIKQALFSATYPGEAGRRLSETFSETIDSGVRNIESGLFQSLPAMARAEGLIRTGERPRDLALSDDLATAVDVLARLRAQRVTVQDYLSQSSMFERELTPLQEQLLSHLDNLSRAPRQIRDFIQEYANGVESQPHTAQTGMFGEVPRQSKGELIDRAAGGATSAAGLEEQAAAQGLIGRADPGIEQAIPQAPPATAPESVQLAGSGAGNRPPPPRGPQGVAGPPPPPPTGQTPPSNRGRLPQLQRPINWRAPTPPAPPRGARPIELTAEQETQRLNLSKFPEEIHEDLLRGAQGVDWARAQRRGVLPDAVVNDLADEMGRSVESWIRQRSGRSYSPEETVALRNAVTAQGFKVADLSSQVNAAKSAGLTTDLLLAQFDAEAQKLRGLVQVAEGARAEAGRTLRAYSFQTRNVEANPSDAAARLVKKFGGDRQRALEAIGEFNQMVQDGAGPIEQAKFWARAEGGPVGFTDWFKALRYNSMLSGPRTFEINAVGNLTEIPWRLARDVGASTIRGRPQEVAPELTGLWVGMQKGAGAFMETLQHGITTEQALAGDVPRSLASRIENPVGRTAATVLEAPGRIMQATDAMAQQMAYAMVLGREAAVKARGQANWSAEVERLMDNPTEQMMANALGAADRMTYHGQMGGLGEASSKFQQHWLGNIVMPFLRTVYHITARGIDRSPLGLVGTGIDVARGAYRGGAVPQGAAPLGERLGDNLMGTLAGAFLVGQAFQGNISASGPEDPRQKDLLRGQGWQPYSVKVGNNWVSYSNWGPMSVPFSMAAALAEANLYRKPDDSSLAQGLDTFRRFGELATEQTYLQGIGGFYKAVKDPQAYGTQWLTGFVNSLVPFGAAVSTVGQATDPFQRRPERYDVGGALAARFPGIRQGQPVAQDVLGRAITNEQQGPGAFQPLRISGQKQDAMLKAFTDAGIEIGRPPQQITVRGQSVDLTPAEQRQYQQTMGRELQFNALDALAEADPTSRAKKLQRALDAARGSAAQQILESGAGLRAAVLSGR